MSAAIDADEHEDRREGEAVRDVPDEEGRADREEIAAAADEEHGLAVGVTQHGFAFADAADDLP